MSGLPSATNHPIEMNRVTSLQCKLHFHKQKFIKGQIKQTQNYNIRFARINYAVREVHCGLCTHRVSLTIWYDFYLLDFSATKHQTDKFGRTHVVVEIEFQQSSSFFRILCRMCSAKKLHLFFHISSLVTREPEKSVLRVVGTSKKSAKINSHVLQWLRMVDEGESFSLSRLD